ncbi:Hypp4180 [Branchiostoma lanceolatum]|uniref:Hypp4180 protein n=1 Tax=Branchiostoma lanceolatum TaxID=7740 RepID=A0A8K0AAV1_BRALA|nr:Hypp4180 [Branchiostoma lanceolatum]
MSAVYRDGGIVVKMRCEESTDNTDGRRRRREVSAECAAAVRPTAPSCSVCLLACLVPIMSRRKQALPFKLQRKYTFPFYTCLLSKT